MQTSIEKFEDLYTEFYNTPKKNRDQQHYHSYTALYDYLNEILSAQGISYKSYFESEIAAMASDVPHHNPNGLPFNQTFIDGVYSNRLFKFYALYIFFQIHGIEKNTSPKGLTDLGLKNLKSANRCHLDLIFEFLYDIDLSNNIQDVIRLIDAILEKKEHEEYTPQDLLIWMEMVISEWYAPGFDEVIRKGLNHKYERTPDYFSHLSKTIEKRKK